MAEVMGATAPHVVVVGAGLAGVTTANTLALRGVDVTVVESHGQAAMHASFANAGRFCPQTLASNPLASPAKAWAFIKSQLAPRSATACGTWYPSHIQVSGHLLRWGVQWLRACTPGRAAGTAASATVMGSLCTTAMHRVLDDLHTSLGEDVVQAQLQRRDGSVFVFANAAAARDHAATLAAAVPDAAHGLLPTAESCAAACNWLRPWAAAHPAAAGVHAHCEWTADACNFTRLLAAHAVDASATRLRRGTVTYRYNTRVTGVATDTNSGVRRVTAVHTHDGDALPCDAMVVAAGLGSRPLCRSLFGLTLPLHGMRGFSVDLFGVRRGPAQCTVDYASGPLSFQVTPFADGRVRLLGFAQLTEAHPSDADVQAATDTLVSAACGLLPDMTWQSARTTWYGLRPMSPDGLPVVSAVPRHSNAFLNCGHGANGWTMSCATAELVTALVTAQPLSAPYRQLLKACDVNRFNWL